MIKVLYASRAYESMPNEGGFVLLRDLARGLGDESRVSTAFLSVRNDQTSIPRRVRAYAKPGWSRFYAWRFVSTLLRHQHRFDLVHLAHMPTPGNALIMSQVAGAGRRRGVRYVQTVTALPSPPLRLRVERLLWGDHVVCLNQRVKTALEPHHPRVSCIPSVPDPARLQAAAADSSGEAQALMPPGRTWVVMPFNFGFLPQHFPLARVVEGLLDTERDVGVVVPYRVGEQRMAQTLRQELRTPFRSRVLLVDAQSNVLSYVARARVMIYPMADVPRKFNPPLITLEAAGLGVKVLASNTIYVPNAFRKCIGVLATAVPEDWIQEARRLLRTPKEDGCRGMVDTFASYLEDYRRIYVDCRSTPLQLGS